MILNKYSSQIDVKKHFGKRFLHYSCYISVTTLWFFFSIYKHFYFDRHEITLRNLFLQFFFQLIFLFVSGLATANSSSLSSGELLINNPSSPRVFSSPSTASLQLKSNEPMTVELTAKSTSAPLLDNNNAKIIEKIDAEDSVSLWLFCLLY